MASPSNEESLKLLRRGSSMVLPEETPSWWSFGDFAHWPASFQQSLRGIGVTRRWRDGQTLLRAGEIADSALLIVRGRVRCSTYSAEGNEQIVGWFKQGEIGALASVLADVPFPYDFIAEGPCEVMHFERKQLRGLLERDALAAMAITRLLSIRLCQVMDMLMIQSFATLAEKVWTTLERMARSESTQDETGAIPISISHASLAHAVGGSRYRVGLELKKLAAAGRIQMGRGRISVLLRNSSASRSSKDVNRVHSARSSRRVR